MPDQSIAVENLGHTTISRDKLPAPGIVTVLQIFSVMGFATGGLCALAALIDESLIYGAFALGSTTSAVLLLGFAYALRKLNEITILLRRQS